MDPKLSPGGLLEPLGLLKASWSAPGGLLKRSWKAPGAKKSSLERLLAAPRGIPREVSAVLEAKKLPKRTPGGSQIRSQRRFALKLQKKTLRKSPTKTLSLKLQGFHFEAQRGPKRYSNRSIDAESAKKASCKPLEALLETTKKIL